MRSAFYWEISSCKRKLCSCAETYSEANGHFQSNSIAVVYQSAHGPRLMPAQFQYNSCKRQTNAKKTDAFRFSLRQHNEIQHVCRLSFGFILKDGSIKIGGWRRFWIKYSFNLQRFFKWKSRNKKLESFSKKFSLIFFSSVVRKHVWNVDNFEKNIKKDHKTTVPIVNFNSKYIPILFPKM